MTSTRASTRPDADGLPPRAADPSGAVVSRLVAAGACAALAVLLAGLALAGGRPQPAVPGVPDAGPLTGWALPVLRLLFDLSAVVTVGALLTAAVLLRPRTPLLPDDARLAVRVGTRAAAGWSLSALLLLALTASESLGVPVGALALQDLRDQSAAGSGRGLVLVTVLAAALALGGTRVRTVKGARWLLAAAVAGLLPTTLTGHAATAADHELAVSALVVHVVAATLWVGGLLGVLLFLRRSRELAAAVPRFSTLALGCFLLVAVSGVVSAWERLGTAVDAWTSGYGALVLLKTAALLALGAAGWQHRRRLVPGLAVGRRGAFLALAGVEVIGMAATYGLAVALSRTPTPAPVSPVPAASHGAGHPTLPTTLEPVSALQLLTQWRLNVLVLAVLGVAAAAYLAPVRRLRERGQAWPPARTAAFLAGLTLALVALCGGVSTYAPAMISVQLVQFTLVLLVVPGLLLLGAPLTLLLRVRQLDADVPVVPPVLRSRAAQTLTDPLTSMLLVGGVVFAVYRSPLLELALRSTGWFLLVNAATLAVGLLLLWPALGVDPLPQPRGAVERVAPLLATVATLSILAAQLRYGDRVLAGRWFAELRWPWVDPVADQRLGALVVAAGVVLLLVAAVPATRVHPPVLPPESRSATSRRPGTGRPSPGGARASRRRR